MISSSTYTFTNVMMGSFITSQASAEPHTSLMTVTQMADIWTVSLG